MQIVSDLHKHVVRKHLSLLYKFYVYCYSKMLTERGYKVHADSEKVVNVDVFEVLMDTSREYLT